MAAKVKVVSDEKMKVSPGEKMLIDRRRRGENQADTAKRLDTNLTYYALEELDKYDDDPVMTTMRLKGHERCILHRRRSGKPQSEIAEVLGVARYSVNLMEHGTLSARMLVDYWENNGDARS